jgi:proteasome component ECM29
MSGSLDRILERLGTTEDANLPNVIDKLLPLVIKQLVINVDTTVQRKVLQILAHVNKRLEALPNLQLPISELITLYQTPPSPIASNFSLLYINKAIIRAPTSTRLPYLNPILQSIASKNEQQQDILLRCAAQCLEGLTPSTSSTVKESAVVAQSLDLPQQDKAVFLDYILTLMLFQIQLDKPPSSALAAAAALQQQGFLQSNNVPSFFSLDSNSRPGQQQQQQEEQQQARPPPSGISPKDVARVKGTTPPTPDVLLRQKQGALELIAILTLLPIEDNGESNTATRTNNENENEQVVSITNQTMKLSPTEVLPVLLAAACDPNDTIRNRGEELLKKRCAVDSPKPSVNLEDPTIIQMLSTLFLGTVSREDLPKDARKQPASPPLASKLLTIFTKSIAAANCFPDTMLIITQCLFSSITTTRLKQQGMEYAVWVFKHAALARLAPAASPILESCLSLLSDPTAGYQNQDMTSLALRGFTYQAIGQLATRLPDVFRGRIDIAESFFSALSSEPAGVRAAVAEATSSLSLAFKASTTGGDAGDAEAIHALLLKSISSRSEAVRMSAVQWAVNLFPFTDVTARYMCILETADVRFQLAEAALRGLSPPSSSSTATEAKDSCELSGLYPRLENMVDFLVRRHPTLGTHVEPTRELPLPAKAYKAAINFLENCRLHQKKLQKEENASMTGWVGKYLLLLENALVREASSELHATALTAMLATAAEYSSVYGELYVSRYNNLLMRFLSHIDGGAREAAGKLLGILVTSSGMGGDGLIGKLLETVVESNGRGGKKPKFEELDGSIIALGFLTAAAAMSDKSDGTAIIIAKVEPALHAVLKTGEHSEHKASAALALGHISLVRHLEQPQVIVADIVPLVLTEKDAKAAKKAAVSLGFISRGHSEDGAVLHATIDCLLDLKSRRPQEEEILFAAGESLALCFSGGSIRGGGGGVELPASAVLQAPFTSLSSWAGQQQQQKKKEEAEGADRNKKDAEMTEVSPPSVVLATARSKIIEAILSDDYILSSRPETRRAGAIFLVALLTHCSSHPSVSSILPRAQEAFSGLLGDEDELVQEAASRGVAVCYEAADGATRTALVEGLVGTLTGSLPQKRRAVKISGDSKLFGSSSETGGGGNAAAPSLGTAPGTNDNNNTTDGTAKTTTSSSNTGSLTTYKEICSLVTDVGQPDLIYKFMSLANHHAAVNSSRGAAFGFATIANMAKGELAPFMGKLLPRLYRLRYDPQARVRDAMHHIWTALLDDPGPVVNEHFDAIMITLLKDTGSGQWRVRESASLALGDLLQGRKWEKLKPHFGALWEMTLRAMDDVKETTRLAGLALARSVRGLTLRLTDPETSTAAVGGQVISVTLPILLNKGIPSQVPEIRWLALDTVSKMVKNAAPSVVRVHLTELVPAFLESLSGMEDSRLNYVEQHVESLGLDSGRLENARIAAASSGPAGEALDACVKAIDGGDSLTELVPKLAGLVRRGTGLNTRAGAGRFITKIARKFSIQSNRSSDNDNDTSNFPPAAASKLVNALGEAARNEQSAAVRRSFAVAYAVLAQRLSKSKANASVTSWIDFYVNEDSSAQDRLVAGIMLRELCREAGSSTAGGTTSRGSGGGGGRGEALMADSANIIAPIAYLAQYDEDKDIGAVWEDVFDECSSSIGSGLRAHLSSVVQLAIEWLVHSGSWGRKRAAAVGITKAATGTTGDAFASPPSPPPPSSSSSLDPALLTQLVAALIKEAGGRLWEGKEEVVRALGAVGRAAAAGGELDQQAIIKTLVDASLKKKVVYKKTALEQLRVVMGAFGQEVYFVDTVLPLLLEQLNSSSTTSGIEEHQSDAYTTTTTTTTSTTTQPEGGSNEVTAEIALCLGSGIKCCGKQATTTLAKQVLGALSLILASSTKTAVEVAALTATETALKHIIAVDAVMDVGSSIKIKEESVRLLLEAKVAQVREKAAVVVSMLGQVYPDIKEEVVKQLLEALERERASSVKGVIAGLLVAP